MNKKMSMNDIYPILSEVLDSDGEFKLVISGTSMRPLLIDREDAVILTKPHGRLRKNDIPLYRRKSGQFVLHRILKVRENDYVLCGDNQTMLETGITDQDIIGVVSCICKGKNKRRISTGNFFYRLYCFFWCDLFFLRKLFFISKNGMTRLCKAFSKVKQIGSGK